MFASRGDSWRSPVIARQKRSSPQLTKTIKHNNQDLARSKTDWLVKLEAKKQAVMTTKGTAGARDQKSLGSYIFCDSVGYVYQHYQGTALVCSDTMKMCI